MSHEPKEVEENVLNIHGHIHNAALAENFNPDNHFCVSVEMINYVPITLKQILQKMSK